MKKCLYLTLITVVSIISCKDDNNNSIISERYRNQVYKIVERYPSSYPFMTMDIYQENDSVFVSFWNNVLINRDNIFYHDSLFVGYEECNSTYLFIFEDYKGTNILNNESDKYKSDLDKDIFGEVENWYKENGGKIIDSATKIYFLNESDSLVLIEWEYGYPRYQQEESKNTVVNNSNPVISFELDFYTDFQEPSRLFYNINENRGIFRDFGSKRRNPTPIPKSQQEREINWRPGAIEFSLDPTDYSFVRDSIIFNREELMDRQFQLGIQDGTLYRLLVLFENDEFIDIDVSSPFQEQQRLLFHILLDAVIAQPQDSMNVIYLNKLKNRIK